VDAGGFWSRAGLLPKGADGQTLPMPSLGYALPQDKAQPEGQAFAAAVAHDIEPMLLRLAKVSGIKDDGIFKTKLHDLMRDWDALANDIQADPRSQRVLEQILQQGFLRGVNDGQMDALANDGLALANHGGFVTIDGHVVFVGPDKDETDGGSRGGKPDYEISDARYSKGDKIVRSVVKSDFKTQHQYLAEGLGGRWTNREKGYVISPNRAALLDKMAKAGWKAHDPLNMYNSDRQPWTFSHPSITTEGKYGKEEQKLSLKEVAAHLNRNAPGLKVGAEHETPDGPSKISKITPVGIGDLHRVAHENGKFSIVPARMIHPDHRTN
jgi:hypothetical protein